MGKTFALFSTDPVTRHRLREAHVARNAYVRALLAGAVARCRALFTRARRGDAIGRASDGMHVGAGIPRRL